MSRYEVWLTKDDGTRLAVLDDWESLEYVLAANDVGTCTLKLPGDWSTGLFQPDRKVEVWRKPQGGSMALERAYLISTIEQETGADGISRIALGGVDGNDLLRRRIVAYAAGSTEVRMTAPADNMMKAVVRLNLSTASTDTDRVFSTGCFTVESNSTLGPSVTREFSRQDVLGVCQEIADVTRQSTGPRTYFDVREATSTSYQFRTYVGQLGIDHTYPSGVNPVLLGQEYGNLTEPKVMADYSEEVTVVYGGGRGESTARYVYEIEDTVRTGRSIWGRKEAFQDARTEADSTAVQEEARTALAAGRPRLHFSGKIVDSPGTVYGIHWHWGDKMSACYQGQTYSVQADVLRVTKTAEGETIEGQLEQDEST